MNPMDEEIHALFDGIYHPEKECFFCKESCKNKCAIECIQAEAARRRIILLLNDSSLKSVTNAMRVFLKLILYGILEDKQRKYLTYAFITYLMKPGPIFFMTKSMKEDIKRLIGECEEMMQIFPENIYQNTPFLERLQYIFLQLEKKEKGPKEKIVSGLKEK